MGRLLSVLVCAVMTGLAVPDLSRAILETPRGDRYVAGQVILELNPNLRGRVRISRDQGVALFGSAALDSLNRTWQVDDITPLLRDPNPDELARKHGCDLQYLVQFDPAEDVAHAVSAYQALDEVAHACPNAWLPLTEAPNDPLFAQQWHLPKLGAPRAWDVAHGSQDVLVAVLDDGCEWHHPDIQSNLWVNEQEDINGNGRLDTLPPPEGDLDGVDQDLNGYADDVIGWDFMTNDPDPAPWLPTDDHGTHCWGIANAVTNNAEGVAGVPWNCRSFAFRCGGLGGINIYAAIAAIYYAVPEGAFVFSMSFGNYSPYQPMADACQYAWESGSVLVGGAGNDNTNQPFYPANYDNVVSVAASGPNDTRTSWSNYGDWIEVTAPGASIYSTVTDHGYGPKDGTSMACPVVAGALAWIKSAFPAVTNAQACSALYNACDSMPDDYYRNGQLGHGRVSIANVILPLYHCDLQLTDWRFNDAAGNGNGRPDPGETVALIVTYHNTTGWQNALSVTATLACSDPEVLIPKNTAGFPDIPAGTSADCSADSFVVTVPESSPPQELSFSLCASASPDPAHPDSRFRVVSGTPHVLIVDDDNGMDYERWFAAACDSNSVLYDIYEVQTSGSPSADTLIGYPVVIWFCGDDSLTTLTATDQSNLASYLDQGGNLMLSGQNVAQNLATETFLYDYLHAELASQSTGKPFLVGISGDPICQGDTMVAGGGGGANNGRSLDGVRPVNGGIGCAFFKDYGDSTVQAVVRYAGGYSLVFFAVPFEAIDHSTSLYLQKWTLVRRILEYFGERIPGVAELPRATDRPASIALRITPNPFVSSADVEFSAPAVDRAEVRVYRTTGALVHRWNLELTRGECTRVRLDGRSLESGIYIVQLVSSAGVTSQKAVVLR